MQGEAVEWLRVVFESPFQPGPGKLTLTLIVGALSLWLGVFVRAMDWLDAVAMAAMVGSFFHFMVFSITHRFGPLSPMGLGMMFVLGVMIALPIVGAIRLVMRWTSGKPIRAE
jgi:hypothetical protein